MNADLPATVVLFYPMACRLFLTLAYVALLAGMWFYRKAFLIVLSCFFRLLTKHCSLIYPHQVSCVACRGTDWLPPLW